MANENTDRRPMWLSGTDAERAFAAEDELKKNPGNADAAADLAASEKHGRAVGAQANLHSDYKTQQLKAKAEEDRRRAELAASWQGNPARSWDEAAARYNQLNISGPQSDWIAESRRMRAEADAKANEIRTRHNGWSSKAIAALNIYDKNPGDQGASDALSKAFQDIGNEFGKENGVEFLGFSKGDKPINGESVVTLKWKKPDGEEISREFSASKLLGTYKNDGEKADIAIGALDQVLNYGGKSITNMTPLEKAQYLKTLSEMGVNNAKAEESLARAAAVRAGVTGEIATGGGGTSGSSSGGASGGSWGGFKDAGARESAKLSYKDWLMKNGLANDAADAEAKTEKYFAENYPIEQKTPVGVTGSNQNGTVPGVDDLLPGAQPDDAATSTAAPAAPTAAGAAAAPAKQTAARPPVQTTENPEDQANRGPVVQNGQQYDANGNFVSRYEGQEPHDAEVKDSQAQAPANDPNAEIELKGRYTHSRKEAWAALNALENAANTSEPEYDPKTGGYKPVTFHAPKDLVPVFDRMLGKGERLDDGTANYQISDKNWEKIQHYLHGEEETEPQAQPEEYDNDLSAVIVHAPPKARDSIKTTPSTAPTSQPASASAPKPTEDSSTYKRWSRDTGSGVKVYKEETARRMKNSSMVHFENGKAVGGTKFDVTPKYGDDMDRAWKDLAEKPLPKGWEKWTDEENARYDRDLLNRQFGIMFESGMTGEQRNELMVRTAVANSRNETRRADADLARRMVKAIDSIGLALETYSADDATDASKQMAYRDIEDALDGGYLTPEIIKKLNLPDEIMEKYRREKEAAKNRPSQSGGKNAK